MLENKEADRTRLH